MGGNHGGPGRGQGRKKLGVDRGGLVPLLVNIFADQAERLKALDGRGMAQGFIRLAIDEALDRQEDARKRLDKK